MALIGAANHSGRKEWEFGGPASGLVIRRQGSIHKSYLSHLGKDGSLQVSHWSEHKGGGGGGGGGVVLTITGSR